MCQIKLESWAKVLSNWFCLTHQILYKKSIRCIKLKQMRHTSYSKKIETLRKEGWQGCRLIRQLSRPHVSPQLERWHRDLCTPFKEIMNIKLDSFTKYSSVKTNRKHIKMPVIAVSQAMGTKKIWISRYFEISKLKKSIKLSLNWPRMSTAAFKTVFITACEMGLSVRAGTFYVCAIHQLRVY